MNHLLPAVNAAIVGLIASLVPGCSSKNDEFHTAPQVPSASPEAFNNPAESAPRHPSPPIAGPFRARPNPSTCESSPANFDIPKNGCDDDGDGAVDNTSSCDSTLAVTGPAEEFAKTLGICQVAGDAKWGVVSATYTNGFRRDTPPADAQHGILPKFGDVIVPREGGRLGVLSTGWAREFDSDRRDGAEFKGPKDPPVAGFSNAGAAPRGFPKAADGCAISDRVYDQSNLRLELKVPSNAKGLQFDFNFYSGEWPEFVCTRYNDGFIAYLSSKAFNEGKADNISFDAKGNPVSVNNGFFDRCTPGIQIGCSTRRMATAMSACPGGADELKGTGFYAWGTYCGIEPSVGGGATGWLTSEAPVAPGETITLEFMIWNTGDSNFNSSVLLDHFRWVADTVVAGTTRPPR